MLLAGRRPSALLLVGSILVLAACDFQGPWSYYPEEREIYRGIYTYGFVEEGSSPHVCFSKLYALTEAAAENFAFYDSAYVTVTGKFEDDDGEQQLFPNDSKFGKTENCFGRYGLKALEGESYELKAFFKWDSAGHTVKSNFRATATIPSHFGIKGVNVPLPQKKYEWHDYDADEVLKVNYLEFPYDMDAYKFAMDYDSTVGGVLAIMEYHPENGGESMKNMVNFMLKGLTEPDSMGYTRISMHNGFETMSVQGYSTNEVIAGISGLDTLMTTNMALPIGSVVMHFYATDKSYADYRNFMLQSFSDPRIVAKTNVENGMGVFSGMTHAELKMEVNTEEMVPYDHIKLVNCETMSDNPDSTWNSKGCREYSEEFCIHEIRCYEGCGVTYEVNQERSVCYTKGVKLAMSLDTNKWSIFLPDTLSEKKKDAAYADGLKQYCVESNFESNGLADCAELYDHCQVQPKKNYCKKYLWQWCADRNWDIVTYPQCGTAMVSRYVIEKQKSSILDREVRQWCKENPKDKQCERI